ncbi:MAG: UPF0182 family protein [Acidimicrobiia bacterium]|nr:UPF0182 family protein [Acidimicrobiia bacterium]
MLTRESIPAPRPGVRRALTILGVLLVLGIPALRWLATFWTDYLWFDSVELTSVWRTAIFTRIGLVLVASAVAALVLWLNLWLADKLSPRIGLVDATPEEVVVERFQEWVQPRARLLRVGVAVLFGILIGLAAGGWWDHYLLFKESVSFGIDDPQFGNDVGFYVFRLPFIRDVFAWAFQFIVITGLIVAALHYLNGGIRVQGNLQRVNPAVKVHLSVVVAVLALLKAVGYQLDKYELLYSTRGAVFGASSADISARLPALNLLILISVAAAIMLLVNIRIRGWTLPAVALGLWLATSLLVGGLIPAAVQRFSVEPDEINKELPYVGRNITATREAFGLTNVAVREFSERTDADGNAIPLTATDIGNNRDTIDNVRLWDPAVLRVTYRQLQELRTFYKFQDVDVDRYNIGGEPTQVMLAARELDQDNIPGQGWVNQHLVFTHGFGTVLSPANSVTSEGQPDFLVKDIPPQTADPLVEVDESRIYFGEGFEPDSFVFVGTKEREVDFPIGAGEEAVEYNTYEGAGGIELGSIFRRAAFGLRFLDLNTLISGQLTSDTKVLMVRNVTERVERVAPFLHSDADPYLVVSEGRLLWVVDMYTTTNRYPYSSPAFTGRLNRLSGSLPGDFNYIRNSVKAVVDSADGTMDFYIVDPDDPIVRAYSGIFPDLFVDGSTMSDDLKSHLRYPEDLFRVQTDMYNRYHVTDSRTFFNDSDPWQIARDPSTAGDPGTPTFLEAASEAVVVREDLRARFRDEDGDLYTPMVPYYLLMKLPGESELSYVLLQPFTPAAKPNMVSFMVAKSGPTGYGELVDFQLPRDSFIDGPGQVGARIQQDQDISPEFSLLNVEGSSLILGNMLIVPIEDSILYVQPVYLQSEENALPEFKKVVVVYQQNKPRMEDTLDAALAQVFGAGTGGVTPPDPGGEVPTELPADVQEALEQAQLLFDEADAALRDGDLGTYQQKVEEAQALIDQALEKLAEIIEDPTATEAAFSG